MTLKQLDAQFILQNSLDVLLVARQTYPNIGQLDMRSLSNNLEKGTIAALPFYIYKETFENRYFKMITPDYFSEKQFQQLKMAPIEYDFSQLGKQYNIQVLQLIAQYLKDKNISSQEISGILKQAQKERINNYSQLKKPLLQEKNEQRRRDRLNKLFGKALACNIE